MGFGLLLCSYFMVTLMSVTIGDYKFATFLIAAMVLYVAVGKLKDYNPRFAWLYPFSAAYGLLAVYYVLVMLGGLNGVFYGWNLPIGAQNGVDRIIVGGVETAVEVGFTLVALFASGELALSVGLEKHRKNSIRNMVFVSVCALVQITLVVFAAVPFLRGLEDGKVLDVLDKAQLLVMLVIYVLNSWFFYTCFTAICPKGEEFGKPSKPSRFKFINEINQKLDAKNEQARLEYERNQQEKNKKFSAKNNNRHHKKKK